MELPNDTIGVILSYLTSVERTMTSCVNKQWRQVSIFTSANSSEYPGLFYLDGKAILPNGNTNKFLKNYFHRRREHDLSFVRNDMFELVKNGDWHLIVNLKMYRMGQFTPQVLFGYACGGLNKEIMRVLLNSGQIDKGIIIEKFSTACQSSSNIEVIQLLGDHIHKNKLNEGQRGCIFRKIYTSHRTCTKIKELMQNEEWVTYHRY